MVIFHSYVKLPEGSWFLVMMGEHVLVDLCRKIATQNQGFADFKEETTHVFSPLAIISSLGTLKISQKNWENLSDSSACRIKRHGLRPWCNVLRGKGPKMAQTSRTQELSPSLLDWFGGLLMRNFHGLSVQMKTHCVRIAVRPAVYPSFRRSITCFSGF